MNHERVAELDLVLFRMLAGVVPIGRVVVGVEATRQIVPQSERPVHDVLLPVGYPPPEGLSLFVLLTLNYSQCFLLFVVV